MDKLVAERLKEGQPWEWFKRISDLFIDWIIDSNKIFLRPGISNGSN